uniref:Uncharacterized protein n=1 Tax=Arundo donax TaxID=35708 RepID=A0A0A9AWH6_ARUDO
MSISERKLTRENKF